MTYEMAIKNLTKIPLTGYDGFFKDQLIMFLIQERAKQTPVEIERIFSGERNILVCPECGAVVGKQYEYCCKCGQKLRRGER